MDTAETLILYALSLWQNLEAALLEMNYRMVDALVLNALSLWLPKGLDFSSSAYRLARYVAYYTS
jgi:hypothetical protein